VRRAILVLLFSCACAACSAGNGGTNIVPVPPTGAPAPSPTPTPTATPGFNSASVRITEYAVPVTPQYVSAAPDGSVYFGFGANGSGSNLYRYLNGGLTQTQQAPAPPGYVSGGGVYGIAATPNQVYWLSAYAGPSFAQYTAVECGGNGSAAICEPTVDEPTSMLVDANGIFWVGGWTYNGGGEIATSLQTRTDFPDGIVQLIRGPSNSVWGLLQNYPNYRIVQFSLSAGGVAIAQSFPLPAGDAAGSITYGGDGALWFTDQQNNAIGRMDASGTFSEFALSTANALGQPWYGLWQIATACDGSVWFTEPNANKIGRIDASGKIAEFAAPSTGGYPDAIASTGASTCAAPELWVGEQRADKIAAIGF
jgi:virginiamycin B lyase